MKPPFKKTIFALLFCAICFASLHSAMAANPKPFVIPEIREWRGGEGNFTLSPESRIVYPEGNAELERVARLLSDDYHTMFGTRLEVAAGRASAGDISLAIRADRALGEEGYRIETGGTVGVSAPYPVGVYWATRTLLQISEQSPDRALPRGTITDWPDYALRGFMLDCGRKYIPIGFLRDYVKFMSYYKMNTFHIHLNDNGFVRFYEGDWSKTQSAFRLESDTFPGLTARDGHYTKREFIDLQILAEELFVEIVPEFDFPAHSLAFTKFMPEIASAEYDPDHLDLFNPETYKFLDALLAEYLGGDDPVFRGPRMHIGTDEYSNKDQAVVEKFRYLTDYYIKYVQGFGKQACVWGALTHAEGATPVASDNVLMWLWYNGYADPQKMVDQGYRLVSIPDGSLYIVPNAGYYHDFLDNRALYDRWTPAVIGRTTFSERHESIEGGVFAVWNDHAGNGISTKDIHYRVLPSMKTLATKMWTGSGTTIPFYLFDAQKENLSEAPGVNIAGRVGREPAEVLTIASLTADTDTGLREIGYEYTVSFTLDGRAEEPGTVLLSSPDAVFYLSDPVKGMIGFSRDGYLNTFDYSIGQGESARITICGDRASTRIYVNGRRVASHQPATIFTAEARTRMKYIETLVFPLQTPGTFRSTVTDLSVLNYCTDNDK
jgi:hexosaminidase